MPQTRFVALLIVTGLALVPVETLLTRSQGSEEPDVRATSAPKPIDNLTFRPTVPVRQGSARGSGTIIASTPDRMIVLTAAHVIETAEVPQIELHRYNLGIEEDDSDGTWPLVVDARLIAADRDADVAALEVRGLPKVPYVATLSESLDSTPQPGTRVTSVGISHASDLTSWDSEIRGTARMTRGKFGGATNRRGRRLTAGDSSRLFLITAHAPVEGRSGGGLFLNDGRLIGVCVGRIEREDAPAIGLFASGRSVRRLLDQLTRP